MKILQTIKILSCIIGLALGSLNALAFSLGGTPGIGDDIWQVPDIGYGAVGPKNLGEEYRRNTPVMYYACDTSFLDYFGSNGVVAVDAAYAILNALTNADSVDLSQIPLESRHQNYLAQTLGLIDLKTASLGLMMEQMGLVNPIQYTWTLHDRTHVGSVACPAGMEYLVVQRNFDDFSSPLNQLQYSAYVNDILYSYVIEETCAGSPLALAAPFSADPLADTYSPVAAYQENRPGVDIVLMYWGDYYTGLTRDDVAGLKYLMSTNNINWEAPAPGAIQTTAITNLGPQMMLTTSNLFSLYSFAQTNDPSLIPGAFPFVTSAGTATISVTATNTYWTLATNWNVTSYFTNLYGSQAYAPVFVTSSNIASIYWQKNYIDTFGNIVTNGNLNSAPGLVLPCTNVVLNYSSNTPALLVTTTLGNLIGSQAGSPAVPITSVQQITLNTPSGEYFVLPNTNQCGWEFLCTNPIANVVAVTNLLTSATNNVSTNGAGFVGTQMIVTYFTNHTYIVSPINCSSTTATSGPALYQGIGKIQFIRADYDSLTGLHWQPVTNNYSMVSVANGRAQKLQFQRIVTQPDILFDAADVTSGQGVFISRPAIPNFSFSANNVSGGLALAGPGTIISPTVFTFNKVGPVFYNGTAAAGDVMDGLPYFTDLPGSDLTNSFYLHYFVWASYDGTTNAPVVYPNGTSIDSLANEVLTQLSPASPLTLTNGVYYSQAFTASGGGFSGPFTWSATGLPTGLTISSGGMLSGTPTQTGTFAFTLTLVDSLGRTGQWSYTITIQ